MVYEDTSVSTLTGVKYTTRHKCNILTNTIGNKKIPPLFGLFPIISEIFGKSLIFYKNFIIKI